MNEGILGSAYSGPNMNDMVSRQQERFMSMMPKKPTYPGGPMKQGTSALGSNPPAPQVATPPAQVNVPASSLAFDTSIKEEDRVQPWAKGYQSFAPSGRLKFTPGRTPAFTNIPSERARLGATEDYGNGIFGSVPMGDVRR